VDDQDGIDIGKRDEIERGSSPMRLRSKNEVPIAAVRVYRPPLAAK